MQIDPSQNYLYNGKERDSDLGLDWDHYGFRVYDASIGRFTGIDPISDKFAHVSTYNYAENEPIGHIDLWGLQKAEYRMENAIEDGSPEFMLEEYVVSAPKKGNEGNVVDVDNQLGGASIRSSEKQSGGSGAENTDSGAGTILTASGAAVTAVGELKYSSQKLGIEKLSIENPNKGWFAKNNQFQWGHEGRGPNQHTGSRGTAAKVARPFKIAGTGLGVINYAFLAESYDAGKISGFEFGAESTSNTISTFGGIYGVAWTIGWEGGRAITETDRYHKWKVMTWLPYRYKKFGY